MKLLSVFLIIIGSICLLLSVLFKITHWSGVNLFLQSIKKMNKKIILFLLLLPFFEITVKAQSYDNIHIEKSFKYLEDSCKNFISFACSVNGMPSENTFRYMDLIISERSDLIEKLLYSDNPSNQFLSVIILEFLEKKRKITINDIVKKQISGIKQSEKIISVCRGCTYHNQLSLKELLF